MERITHYKRGGLSSFGVTAVVVALLLTAVSSSVLVLNLWRLDASRVEVARINTVLKQVADLHEAVRAAETGQRGFLLTGDQRYLATYEQAVPRVWSNLEAAERTVRVPQQVQRLASLRALIESKLDELANTVALHARSQNAALQVVRSDIGQQLMERIDASIHEMRDAGSRILEAQSADERRDAAWSTTVAILSGVLALAAAVLGVFSLVGKRAQTRLFEAEERFRNLATNIQEAFWVSDPRTSTLLYINPAFERIWGLARAALYKNARLWLEAIVPEDRERVRGSYAEHAARGTYDETYRITRPDGALRWIRDRGWPVHDENDKFEYVVGIAEDITQVRQAQDALAALNADLERRVEDRTQALAEVNRELDAFAYSISHDLRAPLRAMQGYADALIEDFGSGLPAEGRHYTQRIAAAATRMEDLIADILAYSRLAKDEVSVRPESLEAVLDQVLADLEPVLTRREAAVRVKRPLPEVQANRVVLRQALNNLITNAVKFVGPGDRPAVSVHAELRSGRVRLWIDDNGIGIASEHQQRIFAPFQRLHGVEAYPGTGIGLAIVRRAVTRMSGACGVESEFGQGSRFWIELRSVEQRA
ncbi:PAS domain S-box-containing protein [Methylobacterium sp. OAE515]|uniref:sensor histidine kinase n=1 Tax=Methylobacterium sp. OAE515 TaxID=2817895 RepID=UPI00178BBCD1